MTAEDVHVSMPECFFTPFTASAKHEGMRRRCRNKETHKTAASWTGISRSETARPGQA